jgi:hypothetical protein
MRVINPPPVLKSELGRLRQRSLRDRPAPRRELTDGCSQAMDTLATQQVSFDPVSTEAGHIERHIASRIVRSIRRSRRDAHARPADARRKRMPCSPTSRLRRFGRDPIPARSDR